MTDIETCPYCETMLSFQDDRGRAMRFTPHDDAFCRDMMKSRLRELEHVVKSKVEETARHVHTVHKVLFDISEARDESRRMLDGWIQMCRFAMEMGPNQPTSYVDTVREIDKRFFDGAGLGK